MFSELINKKTDIKNIKTPESLIIKNILIPDKTGNKEHSADILIEKGVIRSAEGTVDTKDIEFEYPLYPGINTAQKHVLGISPNGKAAVLHAGGLTGSVSFTDMHAHLREPGDEEEEDINSGINAALRGGITVLCCMPNTRPAIDNPYLVSFIKIKAAELDFNIYPAAAITKGLNGFEITDFGLLKDAGAVAFSDDGRCVQDAKLMYEIMRYANYHDSLLILHEEDYSFSASGCMHEGYYSAKLGLDGILPLSEDIIIARDIMLAEKTGARVHITHISSKRSVDMIKNAKEMGINITCDVTPHHIFFNDSALENYNTNLKVNPPVRGPEDQEALIAGLKSGIIDAIASDHAPHLDIEKNTTFIKAANGTTGLETLFKAAYTKLCIKEKFGFLQFMKLISSNPSSILGQKPQKLSTGSVADIVILDTKKQAIFDANSMFSRSRNSAFDGIKLYGEVMCTIKNGKIVFLDY